MMVVVAPWIIVVISTEVTVSGSAGCVTMVREMVAVHSQEVEYTAHQKLEDAETAYQLQ